MSCLSHESPHHLTVFKMKKLALYNYQPIELFILFETYNEICSANLVKMTVESQQVIIFNVCEILKQKRRQGGEKIK